jgi:hypothetical protein
VPRDEVARELREPRRGQRSLGIYEQRDGNVRPEKDEQHAPFDAGEGHSIVAAWVGPRKLGQSIKGTGR